AYTPPFSPYTKPWALDKLYPRHCKTAPKNSPRFFQRPDVYSHHNWARYRLARCLDNQGDWLGALRELVQVGFLAWSDGREAPWRINFILDVKLTRAQLERHEADIRGLGLSTEWEMAMIARDLRDERLRDAVRRIENFVLNHPHHPQARALWQRLCQLERNLIPTVEISQSIKTLAGSNVSTFQPANLARWTRRLLRAQTAFKHKVRLHLSRRHPMDDVLFEARLSPPVFRAQRWLHRLINRLSWHVRFWNAYGGPPNDERLAFDHAFYYARHPRALRNYSGSGFNADVLFPPQWGMAFDPTDVTPQRWRPEDALAAQRYLNNASSRLRSGRLFEQFIARYPRSRLLPRALLFALQAHHLRLAVTRDVARQGLFLPLEDWQETFRLAQRDFALLRAHYRGSREERHAAALRCQCQQLKEEIGAMAREQAKRNKWG
ncbi:MAG: hypothetical protein RMK49_15940, partial [Abditibacteriales bacterium]|nr:hypothetical protein [Abditibacteriales bacterium]